MGAQSSIHADYVTDVHDDRVVSVENLYIDYKIHFDICGWETILPPSRDLASPLVDPVLIPTSTSYYLEVKETRSHEYTWWPYYTDSANWPEDPDEVVTISSDAYPDWAEIQLHKREGGKPQCDVDSYTPVQERPISTVDGVTYSPQYGQNDYPYNLYVPCDEGTSTIGYHKYDWLIPSWEVEPRFLDFEQSLVPATERRVCECLVREWDGSVSGPTFLVDTADYTSSPRVETFWIRVETRGKKIAYWQIETEIKCGNETLYYPPDITHLSIMQNSTWPHTNHTLYGYWSDLHYNCNITLFEIARVVDYRNVSLLTWEWQDLMKLEEDGNFTFKRTDITYTHHMVYINFHTREKS